MQNINEIIYKKLNNTNNNKNAKTFYLFLISKSFAVKVVTCSPATLYVYALHTYINI